jgi:hypothetical protein
MFYKIGRRSFLNNCLQICNCKTEHVYFPEMLLYRPSKENIFYKQEHFLRVWNKPYTHFSISGRTNCVCSTGHRSRRLESRPLIGVSPRLARREYRRNYIQRFAKGPIDRSADTISIAKLYCQIQLVGQLKNFGIVWLYLQVHIHFSCVIFISVLFKLINFEYWCPPLII